ncbi:hypothetical protein PENVUL_c084G06358 [Penicillium vulpinum]|uniref:Uncharacterized protein n=1 Tax=Penicillium vulpinum TaxID=29845 RepID=A0A1V6R7X4_9EURO|nr:hypothetical protein PENVUL_c084G06358 [Penicillium vulpinum]
MGVLEDQVIIVTGAASGIGMATAIAALREGARVFGVDIAPPPATLQENNKFRYAQCDLAIESSIEAVVNNCLEVFGGRIDALFNIAGVMDHHGSVDTVTNSDWDRCIAINLTAPLKLMRAVIPTMRVQKRGNIINMSSRAGVSGAAAGVAYTASKHGLIGVSKNVAWRFKGDNIRCNVVCPGGVATGIISSMDPTQFDHEALSTIKPILGAVYSNRLEGYTQMLPEEVAETVVFLASDQSARINGAVVPVDDAWSTI